MSKGNNYNEKISNYIQSTISVEPNNYTSRPQRTITKPDIPY